jgi:plasmid stabilization system protein ParE
MVSAKTFKIIWDRNALDEFKEILVYLGKRSRQAPGIVKGAVIAKLESIKKNPFTCEPDKLKSPTNDDFRAFIVFSYRVTYQIKQDNKEIRILRIRHTSREPLGY